jgi:hypothetical protein
MNHVYIFLLFIIWGVFWIVSSYVVDAYIRYLHEFRSDAWRELGKPRGMFFKPKGSSYNSFIKLSFSWNKGMPDSISKDEVALSNYSKILVWDKIIKWYAILFIPLIIIGEFI